MLAIAEVKTSVLRGVSAPLSAIHILIDVSRETNVSLADILGDRRYADIVKARHEAMRRVRARTKLSTPQIGRIFHGTTHRCFAR